MWKKQIARSQMKQWTIDGFVKSQIFKLFQKMENFGRFWKFQGYGRSLLTSSYILYIAKGKTIVIRKHGIYQDYSSKVQKEFTSWTYYVTIIINSLVYSGLQELSLQSLHMTSGLFKLIKKIITRNTNLTLDLKIAHDLSTGPYLYLDMKSRSYSHTYRFQVHNFVKRKQMVIHDRKVAHDLKMCHNLVLRSLDRCQGHII